MTTVFNTELQTKIERRTIRRIYDRSDKLIRALLGAGLEGLITNGVYIVEEYVTNAGEDNRNFIDLTNRHQIGSQRVPMKRDTPEDATALAKIMEELYQLEEEYKRSK